MSPRPRPLASFLFLIALSGLWAPGGHAATATVDEDSTDTPDPAEFRPGDLDLCVEVGFTGTSLSAWSLLTSFFGWSQIAGKVDFGTVRLEPVTLGLGAEAYYSRPWFAELLFEGLVNLTSDVHGGTIDLDVYNAGVLGRGTLHVAGGSVGLGSADPYAVALLGPTMGRVDLHWEGQGVTGGGSENGYGITGGAGGGINFVADSGLMASVELRYLLGLGYRNVSSITVTTDEGETLFEYAESSYQSPMQGFSWALSLGYRF